MIKLCVGAESLESFQEWTIQRLETMKRSGGEIGLFHVTRMMPRRIDELVDGGSLYWVIKGNVQARQKILEIRSITDAEGIDRCKLMLDSEIIATQWQPKRPFQGWRYFKQDDAPSDLDAAQKSMPQHLRAELSELGLL